MREIRVEKLVGRRVVDSDGKRVGRIHEIRADRSEAACNVESYLVGTRAVLERMAQWAVPARFGTLIRSKLTRPFSIPWDQMDLSDPLHPRTTVTREELRRSR
jgi:sporulation protein YlmC with PRC-barrel domain